MSLPKRRFTSSWGTSRPASSSARPSSIRARKTRRSIASSMLASVGRPRRASRMRSFREALAIVRRIAASAFAAPPNGLAVQLRPTTLTANAGAR